MNYMDLLPFMDKEELKKIASQALNGEPKGDNVERFFPFLDKATLGEVVDKLVLMKENIPLDD